MRFGSGLLTWTAALTALVVPVIALAAPPGNDDRASAPQLSVPGSVSGTLVEATQEAEGEPFGCFSIDGSVWYQLDVPAGQRVSLRLIAFGEMDATLEVFRRVRSQLTSVSCDPTDDKGEAGVQVQGERDFSYLVRVGRRSGSLEDTFLLESFAPAPAASPPGQALAVGGVTGLLDRLGNEDDAWSVPMRSGVSYRINESDRLEACLGVSIFAPGVRSFRGMSPVRRLPCGGYTLYTPGPGEGGRHSILVQAVPWLRGPQPYRLQAARAGIDDTVPGARLDRARRGAVRSSGIDVIDLYRFDVVRRSDVAIRLSTRGAVDLVLRREGGKRLACACGDSGLVELSRRLKRGRYYAVVQARERGGGRYVLRKLARIITRARTSVDGRRRASRGPGRSVGVGVQVAPGASGPVTVTVERHDPNFGWQFLRRFRVRVVSGSARIPFSPPSLGRYRMRAEFAGTRRFAPSESKFARLRVVEPIRR